MYQTQIDLCLKRKDINSYIYEIKIIKITYVKFVLESKISIHVITKKFQ